jgi:hypothetical protein
VFAILFGLILVEQRHHLPHHDVHRVVADFLGDGDQPDAVLGEFAHIKFEFEVVTEEAAERMDKHDIERRWLGRSCFNHALEFRAPVVGGRCARLYKYVHEPIAARRAIRLALPFLVGDGNVVLGLPRCRDAQIKGGA